MKIAKEKGLSELKHHILPRTKGFTLLLQGAENQSKFLIYNRLFLNIRTVSFQYISIINTYGTIPIRSESK
jgi:hypothetical protein